MSVWECACGNGAMSRVLLTTGLPVLSSDLHERGYGESGHDVLTSTRSAENIIANTPYNAAEAFVRAGLERSRRKLALLLRLAFLEGAHRARTLFARKPPSRVWLFAERITFYPARAAVKGSGTTAYAWWLYTGFGVVGGKLASGLRSRSVKMTGDAPGRCCLGRPRLSARRNRPQWRTW